MSGTLDATLFFGRLRSMVTQEALVRTIAALLVAVPAWVPRTYAQALQNEVQSPPAHPERSCKGVCACARCFPSADCWLALEGGKTLALATIDDHLKENGYAQAVCEQLTGRAAAPPVQLRVPLPAVVAAFEAAQQQEVQQQSAPLDFIAGVARSAAECMRVCPPMACVQRFAACSPPCLVLCLQALRTTRMCMATGQHVLLQKSPPVRPQPGRLAMPCPSSVRLTLLRWLLFLRSASVFLRPGCLAMTAGRRYSWAKHRLS